jgi:chemotaxis protein methyltransferase CheR
MKTIHFKISRLYLKMECQAFALEDSEIKALMDEIYQQCGHDFRNYSCFSIKRRTLQFMQSEEVCTLSALRTRLLSDRTFLGHFLNSLTVHVTEMFRDPHFFEAFRQMVIPILREQSFIRIWHAGCSTGEEVYSMAILLAEENLLSRCRIYATDSSDRVLQQAKTGIYPLRQIQKYTQNYLKAGGTRSFSEYYTASASGALFQPVLRHNVVFAQHNLTCDCAFNQFHLILCRNVLIYFNRPLQKQVHHLLYRSLQPFGILGLGRHESLRLTPHARGYAAISPREKLYRRLP